MPNDKTSYVFQIALVLEALVILVMGVLVGVFMPNHVTVRIRSVLSRLFSFLDARQVIYAALAFAGFLIFHQYICWMWQVKESKRHFAKTNRWGIIVFIYGCAGLVLFLAGLLYWQIFRI